MHGVERYQMQKLDGAITDYGKESAELIRLLLLTGFRRRKWMRAKKCDFDMAHGVWTKPSHTVKENKTEQVPLGTVTMLVLKRVMAASKSAYLARAATKIVAPARPCARQRPSQRAL